MNEKYLKAPWHDISKERPEHSGIKCICYNTFCNCEMEMIFYKSRPGSGYKDYFKECAYKGRDYDYDWIKYWKYASNPKQEYLDSLDKESLLSIIKYGLRNSNAPADVTVEDIYTCIGCLYMSE